MCDKTELQTGAGATHGLSSTEGAMLKRLVMQALPEYAKKLVLHAAYFSFLQQEWKHKVLQADIPKEVKLDLVGKMPCGDAIDNLMRVAEMILPEYDGNKTINEIIKLVREYTYPFGHTA